MAHVLYTPPPPPTHTHTHTHPPYSEERRLMLPGQNKQDQAGPLGSAVRSLKSTGGLPTAGVGARRAEPDGCPPPRTKPLRGRRCGVCSPPEGGRGEGAGPCHIPEAGSRTTTGQVRLHTRQHDRCPGHRHPGTTGPAPTSHTLSGRKGACTWVACSMRGTPEPGHACTRHTPANARAYR